MALPISNRKLKIKYLAIPMGIIFCLFTVYWFFPVLVGTWSFITGYFNRSKDTISIVNDTTTEIESIYSNIKMEDFTPSEDTLSSPEIWNPSLVDFYSFIDSYFRSINRDGFWGNWNYNNSYVFGDVLSFDKENNTVKVFISLPDNQPFSKKVQDILVKCTKETSSIISSNNLIAKEQNVDLFDVMIPGKDSIYFYCLDKDCSSMGASCILVRYEEVK
ncbi:hypothetical protein GYA37_01955 [candidate division WWE3 bacterium]|uniref:Uncharacterized protein n=1 Tax=candidate division WWE3 bacterium TaxID=2053526 RepID=A0A7X9HSF0_UNCKA|nr:hypothetical protein [candidate division WWE3 bacterium]